MGKVFINILIVGLAVLGLLMAPSVLARLQLTWHSHPLVNRQLSYQLSAFCIALIVTCLTLILNHNAKKYLKWGKTDTLATEIKVLGINGKTTWRKTSLEMGFVISLATAVFMYFTVKNNGLSLKPIADNWHWILLFSAFNALSEELICRFGVVGFLADSTQKSVVLWISALIFGVAHYGGYPSGLIGVAMASFLGWILARSVLETEGIGIAWAVHFVQDVIIISGLFLITDLSS